TPPAQRLAASPLALFHRVRRQPPRARGVPSATRLELGQRLPPLLPRTKLEPLSAFAFPLGRILPNGNDHRVAPNGPSSNLRAARRLLWVRISKIWHRFQAKIMVWPQSPKKR